ncbi:TPA: hypothetical protein QDB06_000775 [Burkholderia vietnamiensis]|nr:hypothetical protein [Burkholderia vietnamiensis]
MYDNPFIESFYKQHESEISIESKKYVSEKQFLKVYIAGNSVLASLKHSTKALFEFVFFQIQQRDSYNKTFISFSFSKYMEYCEENGFDNISEKSFYRARKELLEKEIIAETGSDGVYYFNINYFFNGDRMKVVINYIKVKEEAEQVLPVAENIDTKAELVPFPQKVVSATDDWELVVKEAKTNKKKAAFAA